MVVVRTTFAEFRQMKGFDDVVREYSEELAVREFGKVAPAFESYGALEDAGKLLVLAAVERGFLVGGAFLLITEAYHYANPIVTVDSLYLRKKWRRGRTGLKLLNAVKKTAYEIGADGVGFSVPPGTRFEKLCRLLGFKHLSSIYWCPNGFSQDDRTERIATDKTV